MGYLPPPPPPQPPSYDIIGGLPPKPGANASPSYDVIDYGSMWTWRGYLVLMTAFTLAVDVLIVVLR